MGESVLRVHGGGRVRRHVKSWVGGEGDGGAVALGRR